MKLQENSNKPGIAHKKYSLFLYVLCLYIFLIIERPWESIRYFHGIRIQLFFALFLICIAILSGRFIIVQARTNIWVYGLLAIHFLFAPFAFNPVYAFDQGIEYAKIILLYTFMVSGIDDNADLKFLIKAFLLAIFLYTIHSLWEFSNGRYVYRMGIVRMVGVGTVHSDPNAFAATLILSLPFFHVFAKYDNSKWFRMLSWSFLFGLAPMCIVMTGSRTGFAGLILVGLAKTFFVKGNKKIIAILLTMIIAIAGWSYMPEDKRNRIRTLWDKDAGPQSAYASSQGRIDGWWVSYEMFKRKPLTGVGAGGKNYIGFRVAMGESPYQSHILYGQVISEFGIIGAFLFLGLVYTIFRNCFLTVKYSAFNESPDSLRVPLSNAIAGSLALLLFLGIGGHNFYRPHWVFFAAWSSILLRNTVNKRYK